MKTAKKMLVLAAFTSIVAVACSTDSQEEQDRHTDYTGLFEPIQVTIQPKDIHDGKAELVLPLASGATVNAELELQQGAIATGPITLTLSRDALFAVDPDGQPYRVTADDAGKILNDAGARSVCGDYPLSDLGLLQGADGKILNVGVSLVASEAAYADAEHKGCRTMQDPGLPNPSCGDDCTIGIGFFSFSGKCDHFTVTVPWYVQGQWVDVPMWMCYCNATAQASATPSGSPDTTVVSTTPSPSGSPGI